MYLNSPFKKNSTISTIVALMQGYRDSFGAKVFANAINGPIQAGALFDIQAVGTFGKAAGPVPVGTIFNGTVNQALTDWITSKNPFGKIYFMGEFIIGDAEYNIITGANTIYQYTYIDQSVVWNAQAADFRSVPFIDIIDSIGPFAVQITVSGSFVYVGPP